MEQESELGVIILKYLNSPKRRVGIDEYMEALNGQGFDNEAIISTVGQLKLNELVIETGEDGAYLESSVEGTRIAAAHASSLLKRPGNVSTSPHSTVTKDTKMQLKGNYETFAAGLLTFRKHLDVLQNGAIETEYEVDQVKDQLDRVKKDCAIYLREHSSSDIGNELANLVLDENRYQAQVVYSLSQKVVAIKDRIGNITDAMNYVLEIVRMSDPLMHARSYVEERADLTVTAKSQLLLHKLYEQRKSSKYWSANMIFDWNQVQLDDYDEARQITETLESRGWVETIGNTYGLSAKITIQGKEHVESNRNPDTPVNDELPIGPTRHSPFINLDRINELEQLPTTDFDFRKLVQFCYELNDNYENENFLSVTMLVRSIMNHIPPVFGLTSFNEVANNYGKMSFKKNMVHLNSSLRNIADGYMHEPIRKKETLPNDTQVNFSQDLDVLLAEVVRKVSER